MSKPLKIRQILAQQSKRASDDVLSQEKANADRAVAIRQAIEDAGAAIDQAGQAYETLAKAYGNNVDFVEDFAKAIMSLDRELEVFAQTSRFNGRFFALKMNYSKPKTVVPFAGKVLNKTRAVMAPKYLADVVDDVNRATSRNKNPQEVSQVLTKLVNAITRARKAIEGKGKRATAKVAGKAQRN